MRIWKHKYPQNIWAIEIVKLLKSQPEYIKGTIVDAPCGNGIIGNLVLNEINNLNIVMLDNDKSLLTSTYAKNLESNIRIEDIFEFKIEGEDNTWLFINSLYCLPNSDLLLSNKRHSFKYIIAVFPNIKSSNYKYFTRKNPNFPNPSAREIDLTIELFNKHGFNVESKKNIIKIPFHKWNGLLDSIKLPFILKNIIFLIFEKLLFFLSGHYTIIAFKRSE